MQKSHLLRTGAFLLALAWPLSLSAQPAPETAKPATSPFEATVERARELENLRSLIIAHDGKPVVEEAFKGANLERPTNIKSASKTILSALVGIAIERGVLKGVDQPVADLLGASLPSDADERVKQITIGHLLSMQAGLERTSGRNYGSWVSSGNWVRHVLTRPFVDEPGGRMLYSTGSTHLLSAALTRASKRSTLELAREWLGEPLEVQVPPWTRDPQGIYLGGNEMAMSPRALLRFGEMYRQGGMIDSKRIVPESWVRESWEPRTSSPFTGDSYGYGWYMRDMRGHRIYYAWGFGGQMIYVAPSLGMTAVMTSDPTEPSREDNYIGQLHALVADSIIPALMADKPDPESTSSTVPTGQPPAVEPAP
ncbi:serine hydrolase domain-containing protein [Microvirga guangxiensis]|uniref:CubicO group peptidase, beta-lactamase class C family n=1 Tax=Microvirga guangxiensis TaxID=549386 RepID=A0A1G5HS91_9HYPH|nr:serine hydrolase [Microvirga guangxiensis]SCY66319.1 CubicO group peptidase, beta-lactamase class C family [Microvirga guangxiensis]